MLSDEEKKEYEKLKSLLYTGTLSQHGKRKLIDMFEKQQKEIEELKEIYQTGYVNGCVSKVYEINKKWGDKIKAKIEEIKNECKYCDFTDEFCQELLQNNNCTQGNTLKVLQSLLEKE